MDRVVKKETENQPKAAPSLELIQQVQAAGSKTMDRGLRKETEEQPETTLCQENRTQTSLEEDAWMTLARLSESTNPKPSFTGNKEKNQMKNAEKLLKINKPHSNSKIKHAVADHAGKCISCKKNNAATDGLCNPCESKSHPIIRAQEVQSNPEPAFPCFVKSVVRPHDDSCSWLDLPRQFCKSHLPNKDTILNLEDECGKQHEVEYIADKTRLSAGWGQFSVGHNVGMGNCLFFQLVEPSKLKVYIISDSTKMDWALDLLNLGARTKQNDADNAEMGTAACKSTKRKCPESLQLDIQKKNRKTGLPSSVPNLEKPAEQSETHNEEVGSEDLEGYKFSASPVEVFEGYRLSGPTLRFEDIECFLNFNILVDGLPIDSELSEDIREKYYILCCCENEFLHDNIVKGTNRKLIAGAISEIVNIADALKACKLTTSRNEFTIWDDRLKAFEFLGMKVRFLRARLHRLVTLAFKSEGAADIRRYFEARTGLAAAEDDIINLEARLLQLREASEKFRADIGGLKLKAESHELKFQKVVAAPWWCI